MRQGIVRGCERWWTDRYCGGLWLLVCGSEIESERGLPGWRQPPPLYHRVSKGFPWGLLCLHIITLCSQTNQSTQERIRKCRGHLKTFSVRLNSLSSTLLHSAREPRVCVGHHFRSAMHSPPVFVCMAMKKRFWEPQCTITCWMCDDELGLMMNS